LYLTRVRQNVHSRYGMNAFMNPSRCFHWELLLFDVSFGLPLAAGALPACPGSTCVVEWTVSEKVLPVQNDQAPEKSEIVNPEKSTNPGTDAYHGLGWFPGAGSATEAAGRGRAGTSCCCGCGALCTTRISWTGCGLSGPTAVDVVGRGGGGAWGFSMRRFLFSSSALRSWRLVARKSRTDGEAPRARLLLVFLAISLISL
jgi:hypothetical protein